MGVLLSYLYGVYILYRVILSLHMHVYMIAYQLNKKFCHKRGDTSNISHLSATKCKFVLLLSWHAAE